MLSWEPDSQVPRHYPTLSKTKSFLFEQHIFVIKFISTYLDTYIFTKIIMDPIPPLSLFVMIFEVMKRKPLLQLKFPTREICHQKI